MVEGIFIMTPRPTARLSRERNDAASAVNSSFVYSGRKTSQMSHDDLMPAVIFFFPSHCPRFPGC